MTAICVDDEQLILNQIVFWCKKTSRFSKVEGFVSSKDALAWLSLYEADFAFLDINMPDINGIELAIQIRKKFPDIYIVFISGDSKYAMDAFAVHANGYLLKPVSFVKLCNEIDYVLNSRRKKMKSHIEIHTFGKFNVLVDGVLVHFNRSKSEELLAYLVDQGGVYVTRKDVFYVIWEEGEYDRKHQKYLDTVIRDLRKTLREYGIEEIFELSRGRMRVNAECFECDLYQFQKGDSTVVNEYRGEYMDLYSWADLTRVHLSKKNKKI